MSQYEGLTPVQAKVAAIFDREKPNHQSPRIAEKLYALGLLNVAKAHTVDGPWDDALTILHYGVFHWRTGAYVARELAEAGLLNEGAVSNA